MPICLEQKSMISKNAEPFLPHFIHNLHSHMNLAKKEKFV